MSVPTTTVEVGFNLLATGDQSGKLILDDTVRGKLDDTGYVLAGPTWTDVTGYVRQVNIRRGRSNELDRYPSGQCTVTLDNRARQFDPDYADGDFYPYVRPRKPMRITCGTAVAFVGQVEDWNLSYQVSGDAVASASGADGFALFAGQELTGFTTTGQKSGERVAAILDRSEIGWPNAMRDIDTGEQTLQADDVTYGTNALQYLQTVEATEPGALFMSRDGLLTFRARTTSPTAFTDVAFDDVGTGVPFTDIAVSYGTELLYNIVTVTRVGGSAQRVDNSAATEYGISSLSRDNLLHDTDAAALQLAQWWSQIYSAPLVRFKSITVELSGLTTDQQADVLSLDLYSVASVTFNGRQSWSKIDSIDHTITPASHRITFGLSNTASANNFVLDSTQYGVLDTSRLGF